MKFGGTFLKKSVALLLGILMVAASVTSGIVAFAEEIQGGGNAPLQIGVIADTHYYPDSLTGERCEEYLKYIGGATKQYDESQELLDAALFALQKHSLENGLKYVLLPGDLTKDGELEGHRELAQRLLRFEQESGLQVIVTNGNHDVNCFSAISFEGGVKHRAEMTSPEQFREIYKDLGWDLKCAEYTPPAGEKAGMLSYAVKLDGNYRLIVMDVCKYTKDATGLDEDRQITDGEISDSLMDWILGQIDDANRSGETVIGMAHHSFMPHFKMHESIFGGFVLRGWEKSVETLADAGMHYVFTGHMHEHKTASHVSDNGSVFYDIATSSLAGYPNFFREVLLDNTGDVPSVSTKTYDVDCEQQIVVEGVAYEKPFRVTSSFSGSFGDNIESFALDKVDGFIDDFISAVKSNGGIVGALKADYGLDLEEILDDLINGGISLGPIKILTVKNLMGLVNDLCGQIERKFLQDPAIIKNLMVDLISRVLEMPVSELPCNRLIDTYGLGDATAPGTFEDAAYATLVYFYDVTLNSGDDLFINDFIDYFRNGQGANDLFDILYDLLLNDLIQGTLLSNLSLNIKFLFPPGTLGHIPATLLDAVLGIVFKGDKSFKNIINSILSLGLFKDFKSINGIADHYIEEYLTQSQLDSIGFTFSEFVEALVTPTDVNDMQAVMYAHDNCEVEATTENYRLPSMVAVTLGEDASTSRNISWYTKYSVTGTDIEIVPYSENPSFSGIPTTGGGISSGSELVTAEFPGVDFGIFGLLPFKQKLVRHTLSLTELEPGSKYCYRVGDAEKGWWSEPGVISTADGSDDVTFLHVTDSQSQNARQYERFHNVIDTAFSMYPDTDFVVSSGDQVDSGTNVKQWRWLLDGSSDVLMNTAFMPSTGNHEKKGAALDKIFMLPNVPEQDTESGVYYSFDYNNVHVMVLNTNDLNDDDDALSGAQISWLRKSAGESDADWKFVVLHKAVYSNGSHYDDDDVIAIRKQLQRLMPELGIDIVFQGHDHVYLRTAPMYNNKVLKSDKDTKTIQRNGIAYNASFDPFGTFYVISGCSGVKNYITKDVKQTDKLFPRAEAIYETSLSMFSAVTISGDTLMFNAYTVEDYGAAVKADSFAIVKAQGLSGQAGALSPAPSTADIQHLSVEASEKAIEMAAYSDFIDSLDEGFDPVMPTTSPDSGGGTDATSPDSGSNVSPGGNSGGTTSPNGANGDTSVTSKGDDDISYDGGANGGSSSSGGSGGSSYTGSQSSSGGSNSINGYFDKYGNYHTFENSAGEEKSYLTSSGTPVPLLGGSAGKAVSATVIFGISALCAFAAQVKKKKDDE